jgi:hypothetical protein
VKELEELANWLTQREDELLKKDPHATFHGCKLQDLPKHLATAQVLSKALGESMIEVGRPDYSTTSVNRDTQNKSSGISNVKYGKEPGEVTFDRELAYQVSDTQFSWTDLKGKNDVRLAKLLAEDAAMKPDTRKLIGLRVRLTTEGMAKITDPGKVLAGV